jgi:hypothetical protein
MQGHWGCKKDADDLASEDSRQSSSLALWTMFPKAFLGQCVARSKVGGFLSKLSGKQLWAGQAPKPRLSQEIF